MPSAPIPGDGRAQRRRRFRRGLGAMLAAFLLFDLVAAVWFIRTRWLPVLPEVRFVASDYLVTLYFTPVESLYTARRGFVLPPVAIPEVPGRLVQGDFAAAVRMEGCGLLCEPVDGNPYLRYDGHWHLAPAPLGNHGNRLAPGLSCAVSSKGSVLRPGQWLLLRSVRLPPRVQSRPWRIDDIGPCVDHNQLDLYWGEDVSAGPGPKLTQPWHAPFGTTQGISVYRLPAASRALAILEDLDRRRLTWIADALMWFFPSG